MAVRNARKRCRGRNCPDAPQVKMAAQPTAMLNITSDGEGMRLWKHVLFGTGTCIGMIEGYAALGMPGDPYEALCQLRERLNQVISTYEAPSHEVDPAEERPTSNGSSIGEDIERRPL